MITEEDLFVDSDGDPTTHKKTQERYKRMYDVFMKWKKENGYKTIDEDVILTYFDDAAKLYKSPSLQSMYSILKRMFLLYENVDITAFNRLLDFLKDHHKRYVPTKGKVFTVEEIDRFMVEAPDERYLAMKVIMVFGVTGRCKSIELQTIKTNNVKDCGTEIIVTALRNRKTQPELFLITGEFTKIVQKYMRLRPTDVTTDKFFLTYSDGKCSKLPMSRERLSQAPKEIAKFLGLDDYNLYTGYSFPASKFMKSQRRWKDAKVVEAKLQHNQNVLTPSKKAKRLATVTKPDTSMTAATDFSLSVENIIVKSEIDETEALYCESSISNIWDQHQTESICEPFVPMLPVTISLMKRKSKYYLGLEPAHFFHLLKLIRETKLISDVTFMLTLRKLRLNEEFEILGDAFDLDRETAEKYYNESKHAVLDLVDGDTTKASMSNERNYHRNNY